MSTSDNCKDGASKSNNDDVCEVNDMLQKLSTADDKDNEVSICANCGKEGANNICNKCKMVRYCNAACKKKHRHKHKKDCEEHIRLAAEHAAELYDIVLFKQPPPPLEDCPICFLRIPLLLTGWRYYACCGKVICGGCCYAPVYDNQGNEVDNQKCPFCRTPTPTVEERIELEKKRVKAGDPIAIYNQGIYYKDGTRGYPQDYTKAIELWHRAAELDNALAYCNIGYAYNNGNGVEVDLKKALHYYELAAMMGNETARHNLGAKEADAGNWDKALKHWVISARGGNANSLSNIKQMYSDGYVSKEDYTEALQSYQEYLGEIKSDQRDKAAAAQEDFRYC